MTVPPELHLPDRLGLPDEVAYLRAAYPQPQWQAHANYGELADFWLHVHRSLRAHGGQLQQMTHAFRDGAADAAAFQRAFVPAINQFLQHLNAHHQIEDGAYFPKFRTLDPRMAAGFDLLEADHHIIHSAIGDTVDKARGLLTALGQTPAERGEATDAYAAASDRLLALLLPTSQMRKTSSSPPCSNTANVAFRRSPSPVEGGVTPRASTGNRRWR